MKEDVLKSITVLPGVVPCSPSTAALFVKIQLTEKGNDGKKRLSITGVVGPTSDGNCRGSAGQCTDELLRIVNYADGWTKEMAEKLHAIWEEWHLNDMRAYCEHQKAWDTGKKIDVRKAHLTEYGGYVEQKIKFGDASPQEKELYEKADRVYRASIGCSSGYDGYPAKDREAAILAGYLEESEKSENTMAGWVHPQQHPEGLLTKVCPVCGYRYGSSWLYEKVPDDVIEWLFSLPPAAREPAWV